LTGSRRRLLGSAVLAFATQPGRSLAASLRVLRLIRAARGGVVRHVAYLLEAMVLARLVRRDGVTHMHAHFSTNATTVAMLTGILTDLGYSFTIHGPDELFAPVENGLAVKIAASRRVICISHFARSQAMLFSDPDHWSKIAIVHCGVHPERYGTAPRPSYGQRVLFVGRLDAVKGGPLLLEAFAAARGIHPDATLDIVGDGVERTRLEGRARDLGLDGAVTFHGYLSQEAVARRMEAADMLVLPSFAEGVPVVLMEAMASRIPVIASRVAGVAELVEDGVSGFVVPPADLATLTDRLGALLADPALCARMGERGRAKVEAEFDVAQEAVWLAEVMGGADGLRPGASHPVAGG
jgi:glycosyltransferase involved in cell wall biosynthesis